MAVITSGNHPKALWPGVKAWFGRQYAEHQVEYTELFDMDTSDKSYEEVIELTGFGLAPAKAEGQGVQYDSETQGYLKRATHVAYALGYITTREERDDNQYEIVGKRRSKALAFSFRQTKETVAANVYNRATDSAYTGGDGKELLATDHPTASGSQSNELAVAADLSEASLEDLVIQIMGAQNSRGLRINLMPKKLIVPRQEWFNANRILKSVLQNDSAQNAVNALKATNAIPGGIVVNHYLTDPDQWFVRTNCPEGMVGYDRVKMEFSQDNDGDTMNAKAKGYERYSFVWGDWRSLFGSPGV